LRGFERRVVASSLIRPASPRALATHFPSPVENKSTTEKANMASMPENVKAVLSGLAVKDQGERPLGD
jgi:hypothetical protein